ncbi:MAG: DUF2690 domain-containing protein [Thermoactinomyces sp.]
MNPKIVSVSCALAFFISLLLINPGYAAVKNGSDPIATGCAKDARTVKYKYFGPNNVALIELRYSPKCRSAWARVTLSNSSYRGEASVIRNEDHKAYHCKVPKGGTSCYTRQVNDAGYTSRAFGIIFKSQKNWTGYTDPY